jgi:hypothetical protein
MKLTWKDGLTTALGGLIVAMGLAVTRAWGWPMLGSYRTGIIVLAVVGVVACAVGGMGFEGAAPSFTGRFAALSRLLHVGVGVVVVVGLVAPSRGAVIALVAIIAVQWAVATLRHAFATVAHRPVPVG